MESGFLTTLGVGVGFFSPTSDVQLDHFLHHTPKLGILAEMVHFNLKFFVETEISCCAPRFPLILTAKFHSLYVKESEILERLESRDGNFGKSESDNLPPTPQPWLETRPRHKKLKHTF